MLSPRLRSTIKQIMPSTASAWLRRRRPPVDRSSALQREIQFWRRYFVTGGLDWQQDMQARFNANYPIQDHVATYIDRLEADSIDILDVGSGPVTKLGKKHPSKLLRITATDLLAEEYDRLLEELGIEPPLRTIYADAENLVEQFGQNSYDIVHGQNCIDHTSNPLRAIEQMLAVCRPQGFVVLYHHENEGQSQNYKQLHQWDFTCNNSCFVIRNRSGRETNVTEELAPLGDVECTRVPDSGSFAILTGIRKRG